MRKIILLNISLISLVAVAQKPTVNPINDPGFISPIVPITVKGNIIPPLPGEAKDFMLWYRGKKVNDSILITPDATLVLFSNKRDMVVVQPPVKKDPTVAIVKELANTQKRKDDLYNKVSERKSSVMMYPIIASTFNEYDQIQKVYSEFLKNTIKLPPQVNASAFLPKYHSSGYANVNFKYVLSVPEHVRRVYNQILYDKKNYPSIEFKPPPARDFGACIECDTTAASKLAVNEDEWIKEFVKYEADLISRTLSIFKSLELLKLNLDPEAIQMRAELEKVIEFSWARNRNKLDLLIRNYGKDFTRLPLVIRAVISSERLKQLLGTTDDSYGKMMSRLIPLFEGFDKYLEQQRKALNYDVVFNLGFILSVERQRQLLGVSENDNRLPEYIDMFNAFNRFKIEMELDYNSSEEDTDCGTSTDKVLVKNDGDQYVTLFAADCKYGLYKNEEHLLDGVIHQFGMGEPVKMKTGSGTRIWKHPDDNDPDRCITQTFTYSNIPVFPGIPGVRLRFCENASKDTLYISPLHIGKHPEAETYLFTYIDNIYHFTANVDEDEELLDELEEISEQMEVYTLRDSKLPKKLTLEETRRLHQLIARREAIEVILYEEDPEVKKFLVTFDAKNGDPTIIDIEKTLSYENEDTGKKGTIKVKIKVVHAPKEGKDQ